MKRSERMSRLHKVNLLQEQRAAALHASARERQQLLQTQLNKLEAYWHEYSARLETLKTSTTCARELQEHHQFLGRLDEAIAQQRAELAKGEEALQQSHQDLVDSSVEAKKIEKTATSLREQEQASEQKKLQKEIDELYANNF
ncbi:MAG: flagellar export protein FliJ [Gammaproteobacteria bacterium]